MLHEIVLGIGMLILFVTIRMQLLRLTIIIGHCTFLTAYVFIIVQAQIAGLDPALGEASADLAAFEWATLHKVLLPQLARWIMGAAQAIEEAMINALITGEKIATVKPAGRICRALDPARLQAILAGGSAAP